MIVLIAEAKSMGRCDETVGAEQLAAHAPAGMARAGAIMRRLGAMDAAEVAARLRVSARMAAAALRLAYEWPNAAAGARAVEAFTGVVFKALDYASLPEEARRRCDDGVGIVSSLYGYLRADDVVKGYRLDFTTPMPMGTAVSVSGTVVSASGTEASASASGPEDAWVATGGGAAESAVADLPLWRWQREATTDTLLEELRRRGDKEVLDLLPADAARQVDWERVSEVARVWHVDFKSPADGVDPGLFFQDDGVPGDMDTEELRRGLADRGRWRTPSSNMLKTLRGHLLREILLRGISSGTGLLTLCSDRLLPLGTPLSADRLVFCV